MAILIPKGLLLLAAAACLTTACVSQSVYDRKELEATQLSQAYNALEDENRLLLAQKKDLVEQQERLTLNFQELSAQNTELRRNLLQSRRELDFQRQVLTDKNMEATKTISEIRAETDMLEQQLEKERIAREARLAEIKSTYDTLVKTMEEEIETGEVRISQLQGQLTVNLVEKILFESGSPDLKAQGLEVLQRVGKILETIEGKDIRVEGHTDNIPISSRLKEQFPSNWELSTARAVNVVHFLQKKIGIAGEKLSACGFSQYQPVSDNRSPSGRAQNRRIQIVLVPQDAQVVQPLH